MTPIIHIIIPAYNEESSIGLVLESIPKKYRQQVIVVDNGSSDKTSEIVQKYGVMSVDEPQKGYGKACLRGLQEATNADIIVFLDADFSDDPSAIKSLIDPIVFEKYDFVLGSRMKYAEKGALLPQAVLGNKLAVWLIHKITHFKYTDLGPFRAIKQTALKKINMQDENFGWTVEMQIKAAKLKMKIKEIDVSYRKRVGISKITGTFFGTIQAGYKILYTIWKYR